MSVGKCQIGTSPEATEWFRRKKAVTLRHAARNLNANLCKAPLALKGHENYVYLRADYWHPNSQNPTLGPRLEGLKVLQPLCESIIN